MTAATTTSHEIMRDPEILLYNAHSLGKIEVSGFLG